MGAHGKRVQPYKYEDVRLKIKGIKLVQRLQAHIFDGLPLEMSQVRAIEVLLRKVLPDLTAVAVKADVTHRFVAQLPDELDREDWLRKYGNGQIGPPGGNDITH